MEPSSSFFAYADLQIRFESRCSSLNILYVSFTVCLCISFIFIHFPKNSVVVHSGKTCMSSLTTPLAPYNFTAWQWTLLQILRNNVFFCIVLFDGWRMNHIILQLSRVRMFLLHFARAEKASSWNCKESAKKLYISESRAGRVSWGNQQNLCARKKIWLNARKISTSAIQRRWVLNLLGQWKAPAWVKTSIEPR